MASRPRTRPPAGDPPLPAAARRALDLLRADPFFRALPAARQTRMAKGVERIASYAAGAGAIVERTDFPAFVGELVQGVFQAIVDASIAQMEAYAALVEDVARSVDGFTRDNVAGEQARAWLLERHPELFEPAPGCRRPPCLRLRRRKPRARRPGQSR
jgi:hypothetical protein